MVETYEYIYREGEGEIDSETNKDKYINTSRGEDRDSGLECKREKDMTQVNLREI